MRKSRHIAKVGLLVVLVTASIAVPFAGPNSPVQTALAAGSIVDDFEDGDVSGWSGNIQATTGAAYEGTYGGHMNQDDTGTHSLSSPTQVSFWVYNDGSGRFDGELYDSADSIGPNFGLEDNNVWYNDGSFTTSSSVETGWLHIFAKNIDASAETYDLVIKNEQGDTVYSNSNIGFRFSAGSIDSMRVVANVEAWDIDYVAVDGAGEKSTVSGTVSDSSGNAIDGATVSTNTSKSTTISADGSWSLDLGDGTYEITASKSGYLNKSQTVTVSGSAVSNVDYSLSGQLSGTVTDESGNPIDGANVSTGTGISTTTDSNGKYSLPLTDGDHTVTVDPDGYSSKSRDIIVSGATTADFSYGYEMQFTLDDRTNESLFADDPRLIVKHSGGSATSTSFNHNDRAFVGMVDGRTYNLTVTSDYPAVWESKGFIAVKSITEAPLVMESELWDETNSLRTSTATGEETPTVDERLNVRFQELESDLSGDGTAVSLKSPEPVEQVEYVIRDENGTAVYNGSKDFDEPTQYYQGRLSDTITNNASELDDPTLDYSGEYANGTAFSGTADLSGSLGGGGGVFGPTGTSGGGSSGGSTIVGVGIVAGGALLAYRQFGNGNLGKSVSNVAKRLSP